MFNACMRYPCFTLRKDFKETGGDLDVQVSTAQAKIELPSHSEDSPSDSSAVVSLLSSDIPSSTSPFNSTEIQNKTGGVITMPDESGNEDKESKRGEDM